jgi:hypothetical protein
MINIKMILKIKTEKMKKSHILNALILSILSAIKLNSNKISRKL